MASLRARHSKACGLTVAGAKVGPETAAKADGERIVIEGCTCAPVFSIRGAAGKGYEKIGKNARAAVRALRKREIEEEEGVYRAVENLRFEQWADKWLVQLDRPGEGTIEGYRRTVAYAKDAFGTKPVRRITPSDIAGLLKELRERKLSPSTQAQHLRVLGSCFKSAVRHGHAGENPIDRLPDPERPRAKRREAAYFSDAELPRLVAEIPAGVWGTLFRLAISTGMREGELAALRWGDIDLIGKTIRVRRTYSGGRLGATKGRVERTVDLPQETVDLLGEWWGASEKPADDALVFPDDETSSYLPFWRFTRTILYPALERAGILREGATGELRTFHSFRHTYARKVLELGVPISWVSRQLGHSSESVTDQHYGHWSREGSQREAKRLEGAFKL